MKRKDLLKITGCDAKRFENYHWRDQLPFVAAPEAGIEKDPDYQIEHRRAEYSISDAFQLRVFMDASENNGLSIEAAKYIAGNCIRHLQNAEETVAPDAGDMWIFYAQGYRQVFPDTGEGWTPRYLKAGCLQDLSTFIGQEVAGEEVQFVALINATSASARVLAAAFERKVIIPDAEPLKHIWQREYHTVGTGNGG
ncbi:hypothetical protein [Rhodobacter sp. 24-YEA-8]|uniref:hypothetical protein n=1 Tax=Rhodobacter sp. 24-YEA-8 TaxID=1884310 RepID=UPI00089A277F|nr:hypothetical protein [Rhodobacter sp. 24-YEA-8]SEC27604.1 hypothetical protein SAMN05519105_2269 [Rhodobacter sp. 24-YEA-8]